MDASNLILAYQWHSHSQHVSAVAVLWGGGEKQWVMTNKPSNLRQVYPAQYWEESWGFHLKALCLEHFEMFYYCFCRTQLHTMFEDSVLSHRQALVQLELNSNSWFFILSGMNTAVALRCARKPAGSIWIISNQANTGAYSDPPGEKAYRTKTAPNDRIWGHSL